MFEFRTYGHRGWLIWIVARDIPRGGCFARAGCCWLTIYLLLHNCHPLCLLIIGVCPSGLWGKSRWAFDLTVCAYRRYGTSGELCLFSLLAFYTFLLIMSMLYYHSYVEENCDRGIVVMCLVWFRGELVIRASGSQASIL